MARFAITAVLGVVVAVLAAGGGPPPGAAVAGRGSGLAPGQYTGAGQVMIIDRGGAVSYDDTPPCICHLDVTADDRLTADFPDKALGRGRWDRVTLGLSGQKRGQNYLFIINK